MDVPDYLMKCWDSSRVVNGRISHINAAYPMTSAMVMEKLEIK